MRLTLIASGATAKTKSASFPADEPLLASEGPRVAQIRERVAGVPTCYTSPALAARETAAAIGLSAVEAELLRDLDAGRWAGRPSSEIARDEPAALSEWLSDPDTTIHGGESLSSLFARTQQFLDQRLKQRAKVIAVSHPSILRAAVAITVAAPLSAYWRIDVEPLSVVQLSSDGRRWVLKSLTSCPGP